MPAIRDITGYAWYGMTPRQKAAIIGAVLITAAAFIFVTVKWVGTTIEVRRLERDANHAKQEAKEHLEQAAKIAREKLELERKLAEIEAKRDAKVTESEQAHINTLDALADYDRALRNGRSDNPSTEQLCGELAALGYPCSQ